MLRLFLVLILLCLAGDAASAQQQTPPYCQGQNFALQFTPAGWACAAIAGAIGPPGPQGDPGPQGAPGPQGPAWQLPPAPSPSECITAHWNGTAWVCVPTTYLNAQ